MALNLKNAQGMTPLMLAAEGGHLRVVAKLVRYEDLDLFVKTNDLSAKDIAKINKHDDVMQLLEEAEARKRGPHEEEE
tara:strand:- start:1347 stop:1580 length:234 start_codon:yes stop_codon:yes gene_type:complete